uniref:Uncharacterized protein n=1 Tax=Anguilla anguilla TaxID=7936 RepID=A0A0E9WDC3_ANGAN
MCDLPLSGKTEFRGLEMESIPKGNT